MSMIGTLWRRAPAWRLSVMVAVASTALLAMFPPKAPSFIVPRTVAKPIRTATVGTPAVQGFSQTARYIPQDTASSSTPPAGGLAPPPGTERQGIIPFSGRSLVLPAGHWQELAVGRNRTAVPQQFILLARVQDLRLTGLVLAAAPDAVSRSAGLVDKPEACSQDGILAGEVAPLRPGQGPFDQECWTLTAATMTGAASGLTGLTRTSLDDLTRRGIAIPEHMLALRYIRSSDTGWMLAVMFLPEQPSGTQAVDRRMVTWSRRFAALLHRGYDGTITTAEATPALTRDPG